MKPLLIRFHNLSIKYKLLFSYLLLISLSTGLFLLVNRVTASRETQRQALFSARRLLDQTKSYLDFKTEAVRNSLNYIALNDTTKEIIARQPEAYSFDIGLWNVDAARLNRIFLSFISNTDISRIHLYMKQGMAQVFANEDFIALDAVTAGAWYPKLLKGSYFVRWYTPQSFPPTAGEKYLYALRKISSEQNLFENLAVIKADVPVKEFETILNQAVFTTATSTLLVNQDREIICTSTNSRFRNPRALAPILNRLEPDKAETGVWNTLKLGRDKMLIGAKTIKKTDWVLLIIIPYRDILALSVKANQRMLVIFLLITATTFPFAFLVAASGTNRLQQLTHQMRRVETGAFPVPVESHDEIGILTRNFNSMLSRIGDLLEEKYQLGQAIKNLELKALQAQINPHFLYNTLDLINWMAIRTHSPEISRVVEALSKFYRLSLSNGEDQVTIQNELEHIKAYVTIQNLRFDDGIQLSTAIPHELLHYKMLKLILQPLVENSIIHGILEKESGAGVICIEGTLSDGVIQLAISDDGIGMEPEQAARMLTNVSRDEHHGYGVKNIHERIQLNYGPQYGLSYQSQPGKGTRVSVRFPAIL